MINTKGALKLLLFTKMVKMSKLYLIIFSLLIFGCRSITPPVEFAYREINTPQFKLASWQKITQPGKSVKIYIEGDGYAFNVNGSPSSDPTPRGDTLREIAFNDPSANVVYLGRPCQFVKSTACSPRYWSTARFAPEVIEASVEAVKQIYAQQNITLIGYSGGAQVAGLVAVTHPELPITKLVTIAGNLDHQAWIKEYHLQPLNGSLSLTDYHQAYLAIPQIHFVGEDDEVIPPEITRKFIEGTHPLVIVKDTNHAHGWDTVYSKIWAQ